MKKFEIGGIYKAVANAETISEVAYKVQIKDRTKQYVSATTYKGTSRYKIKADENGVESINLTRYDGRRALICKADSKVIEMPIDSTYQDGFNQTIYKLFGMMPATTRVMTREDKIAAVIEKIGDRQYELEICQKQLMYYNRCVEEIEIIISESKENGMETRRAYYEADLEECYEDIKETDEKAAKYAADIQSLRKALAALENESDYQDSNANVEDISAEDDGSNDDPDEDEIVTVDNTNTDNEDEDDELIDPPSEEYLASRDKYQNAPTDFVETFKMPSENGAPHTYHVLAVADNGLTFDGKRISREKAAAEIVAAYNQSKFSSDKNYSSRRAVLLLDDRAFYYARKFVVLNSYGVRENIQFVDFGRDEIPYLNAKVQAIVDSYKKQAQKADAEKAAEIAYKASPQYQLDELDKQIQYYADDIALRTHHIRNYSRLIIDALKWIADYENIINEYGLQIEEIKAKIASAQKAQKFFTDAVATENAFKAINAAAAGMIDDGSNDDFGEDVFAVTYNCDVEDEDDEDELIDPPDDTNKSLMEILNAAIAHAEATDEVVPVTFELQTFAATGVNIAEGVATIDTAVNGTTFEPAYEDDVKTQAYLAELDDIDAQIAALQAKRDATAQAMSKHLESVTAWAYGAIKAAVKNWDNDSKIRLITSDGSRRKLFKEYADELYFDYFADGAIKISQYIHKLVIYSTAKQFKAVIRDLVAAIERGDETFTFPADGAC